MALDLEDRLRRRALRTGDFAARGTPLERIVDERKEYGPRFRRPRSGRAAQEIQRLIGRSLRAAVNRRKLGEYTVKIDCDVLQADGGTRCASITGAWVALRDALDWMLEEGLVAEDPMEAQISAVSVGVVDGRPMLDLDYSEDSACGTDMNVVMTSEGKFVEVQGTAEGAPFDRETLDELIRLAVKGNAELAEAQRRALQGEEE